MNQILYTHLFHKPNIYIGMAACSAAKSKFRIMPMYTEVRNSISKTSLNWAESNFISKSVPKSEIRLFENKKMPVILKKIISADRQIVLAGAGINLERYNAALSEAHHESISVSGRIIERKRNRTVYAVRHLKKKRKLCP